MNRFIDEFHPQETDVALCGSMALKMRWLEVVKQLEAAGLSVATPDLTENSDWSTFTDEQIIQQKGWLVRRQIANIAKTRVVLICNYEKNNIADYIGSNTFLEMGVGFAYEKPVYVLNDIPRQDNREEILAMEPIVLNGKIDRLVNEVRR